MIGLRTRKRFSRALAVLLCMALLFAMAGCGQKAQESQPSALEPEAGNAGTEVTGRYVETRLGLPDTDGYLWRLSQVDSTLYLQGKDGFWKSEDDGQSWQDYTLESPLMKEMDFRQV